MKKVLLFLLVIQAISIYSDGYQYLEVDGIQVEFSEIRFFESYGGGGDALAYIEVNETVDLTNVGTAFSGNVTLKVQEGISNLDIGIINIEIVGGVSIKGHTYDADTGKHIYTTASGIDYSSADFNSAWVPPTGYDYLAKDNLYYPGGGDGGTTQETTFLPKTTTYSVNGDINVSLQVETYKCAYYWDGNDNTRHDFVYSVNQANSSSFPSGTPVIGITYLPLYVIINETVTSETYVMAINSSDLPSTGEVDERLTASFTLVFDSNDDFFVGRTIHAEPRGGYSVYPLWVPQFIKDGVESGGQYSFDFYGYSDSGSWVNEASINGMERLSVGGQSTMTLVNDGVTYNNIQYERVK